MSEIEKKEKREKRERLLFQAKNRLEFLNDEDIIKFLDDSEGNKRLEFPSDLLVISQSKIELYIWSEESERYYSLSSVMNLNPHNLGIESIRTKDHIIVFMATKCYDLKVRKNLDISLHNMKVDKEMNDLLTHSLVNYKNNMFICELLGGYKILGRVEDDRLKYLANFGILPSYLISGDYLTTQRKIYKINLETNKLVEVSLPIFRVIEMQYPLISSFSDDKIFIRDYGRVYIQSLINLDKYFLISSIRGTVRINVLDSNNFIVEDKQDIILYSSSKSDPYNIEFKEVTKNYPNNKIFDHLIGNIYSEPDSYKTKLMRKISEDKYQFLRIFDNIKNIHPIEISSINLNSVDIPISDDIKKIILNFCRPLLAIK